MERIRRSINLGLSIVILAVGALVFTWLVETKPVAPTHTQYTRVPEVSVLPVVAQTERLPIIGHGTVRAKKQIDIIPEVSGKLIHVHPDLATGNIIPKGELLFEIDSSLYDTLARQAQAKVRGLEAELARHDQELANIELRLANAREMLAIEKRDYETSRDLYEKDNVGTERGVDMAQQKYLAQRDVLVELESRKAMIPHLKLETEAQLDAAHATLDKAQLDLKNTKIFCPFKARVEVVKAYETQVVTAHFSIARLTDMEAFEISVGIDPSELRWLDDSIQPNALEAGATSAANSPRVTIRWRLRGHEYTWYGHVSRFERVDEATRTMRLVVEVREMDMEATIADGDMKDGPALSIGMFCRTELPARPLKDAVLVPRHAVYDNQWVYVFEPSGDGNTSAGKLERRRVPLLRAIGDDVLVDYRGRVGDDVCELQPGDRVVTSPLQKPVVGMPVRIRSAEQTASAPPDSSGPRGMPLTVAAATVVGGG